MATEKLNEKIILSLINEVVEELKSENPMISEQIEKVVYPTKIQMNLKDKKEIHSKKALTYKDTTKKEEKKGIEASDTKMNQFAKEEGSDKKAATAVKVSATGTKSGNGATTGQANAKFTSKTENPSVDSSDPYKEKFDGDMNTMDKENDEGVKTYVDAGTAKSGDKVTAGQAKAKVSEKAPIVKDKEPIATGIQIKENYTKTELQEFIRKEAIKLAKRQTLEEELSKLKEQLKELE